MKIKTLARRKSLPNTYFAETPFGCYRIRKNENGTMTCSLCVEIFKDQEMTIEGAKKVAEAHWQILVRRCLID